MFRRYVDRYALTPKYRKDWDTHHLVLADNFCQLYGLNINRLSEAEIIITPKEKKAAPKREFKIILDVLAYIAVACFFITSDNFWLGVLGGLMFLVPIGLIREFLNKNK